MSRISIVNVGYNRFESSPVLNLPIGVPPEAENGGGGGSGGGGGVGLGLGGDRRHGFLQLLPEFVAAAICYIFGKPRAAEAIARCPSEPATSAPPQNGPSFAE